MSAIVPHRLDEGDGVLQILDLNREIRIPRGVKVKGVLPNRVCGLLLFGGVVDVLRKRTDLVVQTRPLRGLCLNMTVDHIDSLVELLNRVLLVVRVLFAEACILVVGFGFHLPLSLDLALQLLEQGDHFLDRVHPAPLLCRSTMC